VTPETLPPRPGPHARLVGRGRVTAFVAWACVGALSATAFVDGSAGAILFGSLFILVGLWGCGAVVWGRVWIDRDVLYARKLGGWDVPLRLDCLTRAEIADWTSTTSRIVHVSDATGTTLKLDATSWRLTRLYAALADYIAPDSPVANRRLHRRMARARNRQVRRSGRRRVPRPSRRP
jgi:hypothetical protein